MPLPLRLIELIHKHLSVIATFCFSRGPLERFVKDNFVGEWKYLRKGLFAVPEERATKCCYELALYLRILDDEEGMSSYERQKPNPIDFGSLYMKNGKTESLTMRDVCNKIIHSSDLTWNLSDETNPLLICRTREIEKWERAEIRITKLISYCGSLMH